jgi:hypothetical protein
MNPCSGCYEFRFRLFTHFGTGNFRAALQDYHFATCCNASAYTKAHGVDSQAGETDSKPGQIDRKSIIGAKPKAKVFL